MEIDFVFCFALPLLFTILFCNAAKFIEKLLIKYFPLPKTDDAETTKILSENSANNESTENLITSKNTDISKKFPFPFFKPIVASLPFVCYALCMSFYFFYATSIKSSSVIKTYSKRPTSYLSFNHLISIRSKAATINPCNETDTRTFENFVTLWKERNEVQKKLDKWNDVLADNDSLSTIKEYYLKKIEADTMRIKTLNATWEPQYRIYEECFLAANNSKRNLINAFCFASLIFFNICFTLCCSATMYGAKYCLANQSIDKCGFIKIKSITHYMQIAFIIFTCYATFVLHEMLMENVPEEFLV